MEMGDWEACGSRQSFGAILGMEKEKKNTLRIENGGEEPRSADWFTSPKGEQHVLPILAADSQLMQE